MRETKDPGSRARILAAARKLIAEHGLEATSTKAIAAEAGVPSGLVFYYFETKDALIRAIFDERPTFVQDALAKVQNRSRPIDVVLRAMYEGFKEHRHLVQIFVAAVASSHPLAKEALAWRRQALHLLAEFFRSQSRGKTAVDPHVLAAIVGSTLMTAVVLEPVTDDRSFIRGLVSVVQAGLEPR